MRIYGLDFTSTPSRRKPLVALLCTLEDDVLRVEGSEEITDFAGFEDFLGRPGPWVCGMDFPFGQPRSLVAALGWPGSWKATWERSQSSRRRSSRTPSGPTWRRGLRVASTATASPTGGAARAAR